MKFLELFRLSLLRNRAASRLAPIGLRSGLGRNAMSAADIADHLAGCDAKQECVIGAAVMTVFADDIGRCNALCGAIIRGDSLSAAIALLPEGARWAIGDMGEGPFARLCWPMPDGSHIGGNIGARGATLALALATAAMRGRAAHG